MKRVAIALILVFFLTGCKDNTLANLLEDKPAADLYGLWKGMDRSDLTDCCQIGRTAMVDADVSILKLAGVPKPDELFSDYYAHVSIKNGLFAVNVASSPMPIDSAETTYQHFLQRLTSQYGPATQTTDQGETVWEKPPSPLGLFRITVSRGESDNGTIIGVFYIFDNNASYN